MAEPDTLVQRPPEDPRSLTNRVASGLRWSLVTTAVVRLASLAVSVALARLLGAEQFGVFAVALVALTAVLSLNELGVSVALIRYQGDERPVVPTVMTLSLVGSLACFAAVWVVAPYLSVAFGAPAATWPVRVMSIGVVIDGLVATPAALLQRHFLQRSRAAADITNFGVGALVSVALATVGMGAMSLALGRIAGSASSAVLLARLSPHRLRLGWSREHARALLRVGVPLAGASLLSFAVLNVDNFVVGRTSGAVALGVYVLAFNLSSWPVTVLSQPVRKVSVAAFAEILDDRLRLSSAVVRSTGGLASVTIPVSATLGVCAYPVVRLVYGHEWLGSAPVLVWLAALGGSRVMLELFYDLLVALGCARQLMALQLLWLGLLMAALPIGQHLGGLAGVGAAHCLVAVSVVLPAHILLIRRRTFTPLRAFALATRGSLMWGCLIVAVGICAAYGAAELTSRLLADLLVIGVVGVVGGLVALRAVLALRRGLTG